jgi:phosphonate transport system ATP-binding protein
MAHALEIKGLVKAYGSGPPVLKGIDLHIEGTGLTAVIGPSGTGKSTLLRCINRLIDPSRGEILLTSDSARVDMATLRGAALRESRRRIGMVFQEYNLVERLSVMENVLTGRLGYMGVWAAWRRKFAAADIERAYALLNMVGLGAHVNQRADALSGGQRQRVGIARALMQQPDVLLADEPTSSLDPKTSIEIMGLLRDLGRAQRVPVIVNIHDVELAKRYADRIVGMSGGQVVYDGTPDGLSDAMLNRIYGGGAWLS